jgi:hypothetical protein
VNDTNLVNRIAQLHSYGIYVYGYVWNGGIPVDNPAAYRTTADVSQDIARWVEYGTASGVPLDGIFFDGAYRYSGGSVPQAEYLVDTVATGLEYGRAFFGAGNGADGKAVFNWGDTPCDPSCVLPSCDPVNNCPTSYLQQYIDCTARRGTIYPWTVFVLQEKAEMAYRGLGVTPPWMQNRYNPGHFMNIIHDADPNGSYLGFDFAKSYDLNAGNIYVTNLAANPYGDAPSDFIWGQEWQAAHYYNNQGYPVTYQYGVYDDILTGSSCPSPSSATPAFP